MSETVKCDGCGAGGQRRMGRMAPEDWYFLEATNTEEGESSTVVVWACSEACKTKLWQQGPGKLDLTQEPRPTRQTQKAADTFMKECRTADFGKHWNMITFEHRAMVPQGEVSFEAVTIELVRHDHAYRNYHADLRIDPPYLGKVVITASFSVEHTMSHPDEWDNINRVTINCLQENCSEYAKDVGNKLLTWIREFDAKESE